MIDLTATTDRCIVIRSEGPGGRPSAGPHPGRPLAFFPHGEAHGEDAMAEFPALPLWTDSWMADTSYLTFAERGLYMDLLILCWRTPGCRVPNDLNWIARKLRIDSAHETHMNMLAQCVDEFMSKDGNWLFQKRLTKEYIYNQKRREKNSAAAKTRWANEKTDADAYAKTMPPGNAPYPTLPYPDLTKEEPCQEEGTQTLSNSEKAASFRYGNGGHHA